MKLVVVESPAKAKTIGRFLGKEYEVAASYGHIRDLPSSAEEIPQEYKSKSWARMAVDTENSFTPIYIVPKGSKKRVTELKKLLKNAEELVLATDEDREGESISWHLLELLKPKIPVKRIAFHEITKPAIEEAIAHPREVNQELVRAQESRRILDRLFGYSLSPVLWKKVRPKLSAGRVQSVAVRLVVEREEERRAFRKAGYWDVAAELEAEGKPFQANLVELGGKRIASGKDFDASTGKLSDELDSKTRRPKSSQVRWLGEDDANKLVNALETHVPWSTVRVDQKETKLRPQAPFITSTLQQTASSILGFSPRRTMQVAQELYEGLDLGNGDREGLITYMRTDSVVLSNRALAEAEEVIQKQFGEKYHQRRQYTTKSKMAQEAHEAIRPTKLDRTPESVQPILSPEEFKLYRLIWNRTIASQMADAIVLKTTVDFEAELDGEKALLRANGSVITFPGFLRVADTSQKDTELPAIQKGDQVTSRAEASKSSADADTARQILINALTPNRHETKPPARYTEASLIQRLEEEGIGRPSTYAPTISTIQQRGYVQRQGKTLVPTFLAVAVTSLLREHFSQYVDLNFTARMEDALDNIARGEQDSVQFLTKFYKGNSQFGEGLLPRIEQELPQIEYPVIPLGEDPNTGEQVIVRVGRNAPFVQRGEGGADNTAPVPEDVHYEDLTIEKALDLLEAKAKSNEGLGVDPDTGEHVYALIGPYGPYVQLGQRTEDNKKPKRASLPKETKLEDVDLPLALRLLSLPRELGTHPDTGEPVTAAVGRFGPYVKCESEFRSLEPGDDVYTVGLERALELLAQPKGRRRSKKVLKNLGDEPETGKPIELCEGRFGPFITDSKVNASVPKGADPHALTLNEAIALLEEARKSKGDTKGNTKSSKGKTRSTSKKSKSTGTAAKTGTSSASKSSSKAKSADGSKSKAKSRRRTA